MTIDEAIYCMKAYLPEERLERCINCKYYKSYPICEVDDDTEFCKSSEAHKMAIDSIRECVEAAHSNHEWDMEQGYLNAIECIEEEPSAEPRWIPVTERSPEEDCETGKGVQYSDFVLMSVEHKEDEETMVDYGHTVDGKWYSDYTDCFIPQEWKVIAWMPLPEPYTREK